jgi:hypothetical protein
VIGEQYHNVCSLKHCCEIKLDRNPIDVALGQCVMDSNFVSSLDESTNHVQGGTFSHIVYICFVRHTQGGDGWMVEICDETAHQVNYASRL